MKVNHQLVIRAPWFNDKIYPPGMYMKGISYIVSPFPEPTKQISVTLFSHPSINFYVLKSWCCLH